MSSEPQVGGLVVAVRWVGDDGLLVEADGVRIVHRISAWVADHRLRGTLHEVIPAATSVFLTGAHDSLATIAAEIGTAELPEHARAASQTHVVPVRYDGADLHRVADQAGMSVEAVIALHTGARYTVDFFGFAPGFAYLSGVPEAMRVRRLASPRVQVPPGAVAIANEYTVIYPGASPGGWNILGTSTGESLWDERADPPNRLGIGDDVTFQAVT